MNGQGVYVAGGRWNSTGRRVAYSSGNLSLSILELLVHIDDSGTLQDLPFVYHSITFPSETIAILSASDVPSGWHSNPVTAASQAVGDEWVETRASLVLAVPSVLAPEQYRFAPEYMNYLINPGHPEFETHVEKGEVLDLVLDPRLR